MASYQWTVLSSPVPGREDDYHRWYEQVHIPEILALDGFVSAQRFMLALPAQGEAARGWQLMVVYRIECDDLAATLGQVLVAMEAGRFTMTDAADIESALALAATPLGQPILART